MKKLFAVLLTAFSVSAFANAPVAPAPKPFVPALSFNGKATINQILAGQLTSTVRLGDRTATPHSNKVGSVLPLVNSNREEDPRSFEDQVKAEAYKYVELTKVTVSQVSALSAADQEELKKYYTQDKIDAAKGIVTVVTFKYRAQK